MLLRSATNIGRPGELKNIGSKYKGRLLLNMRTGKTLQELANEIARQQESKRDYISDTRKLEVVTHKNGSSVTQILIPDTDPVAARVTDHTHSQIATHVGVPKTYYDRLREEAPSLLDTNVNHWLQNPGAPTRRMVRTLDGNARAFLSDRYRRLDNYDLMTELLPTLGRTDLDLDVMGRDCSLEVTENKLYMKMLSKRITANVKVNDTVQAGLCIQNSEIGMGTISVVPFTYRLVCLNGMVHEDFGQKRRHVGRAAQDTDNAYELYSDATLSLDDKAFFAKVKDTVVGILTQVSFEKIVKQMMLSTEALLEAPIEAVEVLQNTYKGQITDDSKASILNNLISGGDLSMWGLVNAVTATAHQDTTISYDRATDLETLGGTLLNDVQSWKSITEAKPTKTVNVRQLASAGANRN